MKKFLCLATAAALAVCLVGCSSNEGVTLDRTVTTQGLTYKVSSQWEENAREDDVDGVTSGYIYYTVSLENITQDNFMYLRVSYSNAEADINQTATDIESEVETIGNEGTYYDESTNTTYSGIEVSKISDTSIDGAQCLAYKITNESTNNDNGEGYIYCYAYILGANMHYTIEIGSYEDRTSLLEEILDSASIK